MRCLNTSITRAILNTIITPETVFHQNSSSCLLSNKCNLRSSSHKRSSLRWYNHTTNINSNMRTVRNKTIKNTSMSTTTTLLTTRTTTNSKPSYIMKPPRIVQKRLKTIHHLKRKPTDNNRCITWKFYRICINRNNRGRTITKRGWLGPWRQKMTLKEQRLC